LPIMVRLNGKDYLCGGLDLKDSTEIARRLEEVGVDAINVSAGTRESHEFQVQPRALAEGYNAYLSHAIKKVVGIPVSIAGGIRTPRIAEEILEKGKADFLDVGRALICDPEWALKIAEERVEDIRPCIACIRCDERLFSNIDVACTVNASMGKEDDYKIDSAPVRKKVLIVGGGPAGLEAARIAALRGHDVTLYEKDPQLGGQLRLAAVPPYKMEFQELIDYFEGQLKKLGVKIELQRGATLEEVVRFGPDVVIVATGSAPLLPEIPGIELRNVINIYDALADPSKVGKRVVVWGSGLVAGEIADAFSENGREVTIITRRSVRMDIDNSNARLLLERLSGKGVRIFINTNVERITEDSVIIERGSKREAIGIDSFVVAHGAKSETGLLEQLKGRVSELYAVGDCVQPREAFEAIQEGFCAARNI
jgi:NADPH-dependent 2,4-dienoyl-CoA reductase/sulfur reductase-like enzyme